MVEDFLTYQTGKGYNVRHYDGSQPSRDKSFQEFAEHSCQADGSKVRINIPRRVFFPRVRHQHISKARGCTRSEG